MKTHVAVSLALAGLLVAGTFAGAALATGGDEDREATALQGAKVSLVEAITTAEQQTGGRAYDAGVSLKDGQTRITVETNGPKGVQTVAIDAQSGQVVGSHDGGEQD